MKFKKALSLSQTSRVNWLVLLFSFGGCTLLVLLLSSLYPDKRVNPRSSPSTFFSDSSGMKGAYLILQQLLPGVVQNRQTFQALSLSSSRDFATLIVAGPGRPLSPGSAKALDGWIAEGGQFILALDREWTIRSGPLPRGESEEPDPGLPEEAGEVSVVEEKTSGGYLESHGIRIVSASAEDADVVEDRRALEIGAEVPLELAGGYLESDRLQPLLTKGGRMLAGLLPIGAGRLIVIAESAAFSNENLGQTSNAVWLVQVCGSWGSGRVAFDEFHHGFATRRGFFSLLGAFLATPWGWVCLQAGGAGLLYLLVFRRRFGVVKENPKPTRDSPLELIEARAGLFAAARARRLALDLIHRHLKLNLSRGLGYPMDIEDPLARERLAARGVSAQPVREYWELYSRLVSATDIPEQALVQLGQRASQVLQGVSRS